MVDFVVRNGRIASFAILLPMALATACSSDSGGTGPGDGPAIAVSLSPTSATVEQGASTAVTGTLTRTGGFTGSVNLDVTGEPAGVTGTVGNTSTVGGVTTATITVEVGPGVVPGVYPLTVRGTGSGVSAATAAFTLTVTAAPGYELELNPAAISIDQGAEADVEVSVNATNFSGDVELTIEGPDAAPPASPSLGPLPDGVTAAFTPNPATTGSTLTITVGGVVTTASYVLTVRGTTTGLEDRTANLTLTVTGGPVNLPTEMVEIAAGLGHTCRLGPTGNAFCWGSDFAG